MKIILFLALSFCSSGLFAGSEEWESASEFDFYFSEFFFHEMDRKNPMSELIMERLAESFFDTTSADVFKTRLDLLKTEATLHPDKLDRLIFLDRELQSQYARRLEKAKSKRWLYAGGGAVVGALLGIPAGKLLGGTLGNKALWISIPAGALLGGGAGFLLGNLLEMPPYEYASGMINRDLHLMDDILEDVK